MEDLTYVESEIADWSPVFDVSFSSVASSAEYALSVHGKEKAGMYICCAARIIKDLGDSIDKMLLHYLIVTTCVIVKRELEQPGFVEYTFGLTSMALRLQAPAYIGGITENKEYIISIVRDALRRKEMSLHDRIVDSIRGRA